MVDLGAWVKIALSFTSSQESRAKSITVDISD
jgi:hypothetical protein